MRVLRRLAGFAVAGLLIAGCNGDDPEAPVEEPPAEEGATDEATFVATGIEPFDGSDTVPSGEVVLTFVNEGGLGHNLTVEELGAATATIGEGEQEQLTVELDAGESYTLFCSVPGHRDGGMELEVTAS